LVLKKHFEIQEFLQKYRIRMHKIHHSFGCIKFK